MRRYEFEEIQDIIGTLHAPKIPFFIAKQSSSEMKNWSNARSDEEQNGVEHEFPHASLRVRKAVDLLSFKPLKNTAFITVISSVQLRHWDALKAAKTDGTRLVNLLNRRFKGKNFSYIIIPEVDLLTVEQIDDGLMGGTAWKYGLQPNQVAYKVHFHGVLFVEGMSVEDIQETITHTNSKKRTKVFFGLNRVRAIALYNHPQHAGRNDAGGCVGYSLKQHYRPTNEHRHLETMPEWLRLTNDMEMDHTLRTAPIGQVVVDGQTK